MSLLNILVFATLGAAGGFLAGLLGIGGGMLLVPFMTMLFTAQGIPADLIVKMAVATSLATICFTSVSSVRAHHARGAVRWPIVKLLAPGIIVGAQLGTQIVRWLPARAMAFTFAAFVGFSAWQMLRNRKPKPSRELPGPAGMLGTGGLIGTVSSLVGAGGGFISVPFMTWCNVPIHQAVATSAALGLPIALAGTLGYVIAGWNLPHTPAGALGYIHLPALASVAAASVLTAPLGARTAHRMDVKGLKRAFALLLFVLAAYMLWKALN